MLVGSQVRRVAVIGGSRIPFARAHGAYARVGNQEMLTAAFKAVVGPFTAEVNVSVVSVTQVAMVRPISNSGKFAALSA